MIEYKTAISMLREIVEAHEDPEYPVDIDDLIKEIKNFLNSGMTV